MTGRAKCLAGGVVEFALFDPPAFAFAATGRASHYPDAALSLLGNLRSVVKLDISMV